MSEKSKDAVVGWRSMDSAPKDGTEFLAAVEVYNYGTSTRWWHRHVIAFDPEIGALSGAHDNGWAWHDYTHWAPLLPTPESEVSPPPTESARK